MSTSSEVGFVPTSDEEDFKIKFIGKTPFTISLLAERISTDIGGDQIMRHILLYPLNFFDSEPNRSNIQWSLPRTFQTSRYRQTHSIILHPHLKASS